MTDVVLSASFGAEIFDCEALSFWFEREDVDAYGGILFFEERDLFGLYWVTYVGHVDSGLIVKVVGDPFFVDFRWVQGRQDRPQKNTLNLCFQHSRCNVLKRGIWASEYTWSRAGDDAEESIRRSVRRILKRSRILES